jgi:competence protein ComEA
MNFKKFLKDWFTLSSRERTGILVLLVLILCALAVNLFLRFCPVRQNRYESARYLHELELYRNSLRNTGTVPEDRPEEKNAGIFQRFPFDPNTATKNEMVRLGMEEKIAVRILSYREKGGRFREKEDLLKIYGFDRILFASLIPYINIPRPEGPVRKLYKPAEESLREHPVEINSSDTSALIELRGIGPVLASRIVKYRGLLGGFYSVDQLKEVYGISDSLFQAIRECVIIDTSLVRMINVNEAGEAQLSRHPYIGRYRARAIVTYRKTAGDIQSTKELVRNKIIPEEQETRINAYLSFQMQNKDPNY